MPHQPQREGLRFHLSAPRRAQDRVPQVTAAAAQRVAMIGSQRTLGDLPGDKRETDLAMQEVLANGAKEPSVSGPVARLRDSGNTCHELSKVK